MAPDMDPTTRRSSIRNATWPAMHDSSSTDLLVAGLPVAGTIIVALVTGLIAFLTARRERRRKLYSEATRAALAWEEMLYRVRRRTEDEERDLVKSFHDLQDQLSYYRAWVGSESVYIQRSYDRLADGVKAATQQLISEAWAHRPRSGPGNATDGEQHPETKQLRLDFMTDVRAQLSPWPWSKLGLRKRNPQ